MGRALLPVWAVTEGSNPLLLLPKQVGGLGPVWPKTGCPLFMALQSFQQLLGWNQVKKLAEMIAMYMTYSHQN